MLLLRFPQFSSGDALPGGWNVRRCGRPLGPLSQAHSTPAGGDFSLEHTDAVRFLKDAQELWSFPTCLQDKTRICSCGVRAPPQAVRPPRFPSHVGRRRDLTAAACAFCPAVWAQPCDCPRQQSCSRCDTEACSALRSSPCWMARPTILRGMRPS